MAYSLSLLISKTAQVNPEAAESLQRNAAFIDCIFVILLITSLATFSEMQLDHWKITAIAAGSLTGTIFILDLLAWLFFGNRDKQLIEKGLLTTPFKDFEGCDEQFIKKRRLYELNKLIDTHRSIFVFRSPKVTADGDWFHFPAVNALPGAEQQPYPHLNPDVSHESVGLRFQKEHLLDVTTHLLDAIKQDRELHDSILSFKVACQNDALIVIYPMPGVGHEHVLERLNSHLEEWGVWKVMPHHAYVEKPSISHNTFVDLTRT